MKVKQAISVNFFFFLLCFGMSFTHPFVLSVYGKSCKNCGLNMFPSSPITLKKDQPVEPGIGLRTLSCTSPVSISGNFPAGLSLSEPNVVKEYLTEYQITGTPTEARRYDFQFLVTGPCNREISSSYCDSCKEKAAQACGGRESCYSSFCINCFTCETCNYSLPVTIYVIDQEIEDDTNPNSPEITASYQKSVSEAPLANMRAKCPDSIHRINVVKWKNPKSGPNPVAYAVYADKKLRKYITTITNEGQSQFKFKQLNKSSRRINHFYIISISESGSISRPAVARIKNRDR